MDNFMPAAMYKLSYGLFVLSAREDGRDNACIINTVTQITTSPPVITIAVNKANYTHNMIMRTGVFNVSILTEDAPFSLFQRFGFISGKNTDKFEEYPSEVRDANGLRYVPEYANGVIAARVKGADDYGTHTLFAADVIEAFTLPGGRSATYQYYFDSIKPRPQQHAENDKKKYVCKICGYTYDGDNLPDDFICPNCKHGAVDFELV